jgi:hypothetical protein
MEIAIPLITLGGLYIVSNQKNKETFKSTEIKGKKNARENYTNMGKNVEYLPNTDIPPENFPVPNMNDLLDTVQEYPNPNTATDKYFNQNLFEKRVQNNEQVGQNPQDIYSLTGNYLNSEQFKHNNMVPFDGGKVKGRTYNMNISETVLDNMAGNGSQIIRKIEQAPLFKPEQNMQWNYGMPNQSDFYQSRVNPGMRNNNVKPFETINVGPGLNDGYSVDGNGGFNSGMAARDKWLPKTVDELRVETNPKLEYELNGHQGPANAFIKAVPTADQLGRIEKQRPDTYFINTQDRWLTTNGIEKGETLRSIQELGMIKREDAQTNYAGHAGPGDVKAIYAPQNFETAKKIQLGSLDLRPATAVGHGPNENEDPHKSYTNYNNNRSTIKQPDNIRSGFSGAIGAVIAPVLDIFKPTKKDETINNVRIYGAASSISKGNVYNPNDSTATTIKETTIYSPQFNINNQKEGLYVNNYTSPDLTQRDTTSCQYYTPAGGYASGYGDMIYTAAYNQHNNEIKSATIHNRPNQGGTQIFNQQMHISNLKSDQNHMDGRVNAPFASMSSAPPSVQTFGAVHMPQYYNENINCDRINPEILNAFKNNPYTQSLTTAV